MIVAIFALGAASFVLSLALTWIMIRLAPRIGFVDKPGHRKIHSNPKPLGGGIAIFFAIVVPVVAAGIVLSVASAHARQGGAAPGDGARTVAEYRSVDFGPVHIDRPLVDGALQQLPLAATFLGAAALLHVVGLIDDRRALGAYPKLLVQILAASALVLPFKEVRALTAAGPAVSIVLTILWITAITNAFNFLDNMDGLSSGVAAVCTTAFLVTTILIEQWFVAATLALLLGALLGFLVWNFPPARIFMGDSGSLLIGFLLGVLTVRTTYLRPGEDFGAGWYTVFAPVIVLALPLYDLFVVSAIRIARGKSPFVGDTNHFSHRLVARGMSRRTAVLCLYLVTASTAIAAILLPLVHSKLGALLIFAQTLLVLGVVALLEQHPLPLGNPDPPPNDAKRQ